MENDSRGNAQVVLCLIVAAVTSGRWSTDSQLYRADRKAIATFQSIPAPNAEANAVWEFAVAKRLNGARAAEEDLAKRRKPPVSAIGEARAKHIRKQ